MSQKRTKNKNHQSSATVIKSATHANHVWSWDFIFDVTEDGRSLKIMTLVDEYTRRWIAFKAGYRLTHQDVLETLNQAIVEHGRPENIRSDNGPEFIAKKIKADLENAKIEINYITPGSPWENGWIESFHGKLRDECLNRELFFNLTEATVVLKDHRNEYNNKRPHSSLNYLTPQEFYQTQRKERWLNLFKFLSFQNQNKQKTNI